MKKKISKESEGMFHGASAQIFKNAESLRKRMTKSEVILWERLKRKKFHGLKFWRQHPINNYILDFYCHKLLLAIEIDGKHHLEEEQNEYDNDRTDILKEYNITVLRFTNEEVISNIEKVLLELLNFIKSQ